VNYFTVSARAAARAPHRACLIVNTTIELAPRDPEVAAVTNRFVADLQGAFATALQVAIAQGELAVDDVDAAAWQLTSTALGMATLSKAGTPPAALESVTTQVVSTLRS